MGWGREEDNDHQVDGGGGGHQAGQRVDSCCHGDGRSHHHDGRKEAYLLMAGEGTIVAITTMRAGIVLIGW